MKTINEQIAELVKESGCNLYLQSSPCGIEWSAHQCVITDSTAYPYKSESRYGIGSTPEAAIAACNAAPFISSPDPISKQRKSK